ncbi:MAG: glutamate--tRNA ligase [Oscillospiraceae bacterium]|nr:glutamate--tRNA ligase [Oscillospiraceae bacterium]
MDYKVLADLIFPDAKEISYYEEKYPARNLPEGAYVTRFAPSPTGFIHVGGLFGGIIDKKLAKQTGGKFILRIEDTDQKREIENGIFQIVNGLKGFEVIPDEGAISEDEESGEYGPYKQSERKDIYQAYAKSLIQKGLAYPCFCSPEELEEIRGKQEQAKVRPGYYGVWAKCRNIPLEEKIKRIQNGEKYVIRLKSAGREDRRVEHKDCIKGKIEFPENDQDAIIIKGDGLPPYHFAHPVDDHLMRVTHVIRGDEWLPSLPLHLELFRALEFKLPKFAHTATIMKDDDGNKRKISKRKDPEAAVSYYHEQGILAESVTEYLLNVANSNFEPWRRGNPDKSVDEFDFQLNKMNVSGAVFDMVKLLDVSKTIISKLSAEEIYNKTLEWANYYDEELKKLLEDNREYGIRVLNIERGNVKPRKDIAKWIDVKDIIIYMYDDKFAGNTEYEFQKVNDKEEISNIVNTYMEKYFDLADSKEEWFNKIKDLAEELGYSREVKAYKQEPEKFKGHVGDVSTVLRVVVTGRSNTPDLYEIMQVLGKDSIKERINLFFK